MKMLITARMEQDDVERLQSLFPEITFAGWGQTKIKLTEDEMIEHLRDVDAAIIEFELVTERVILHASSLKVLGCCRNEPEANVDVGAATAAGIPVLSGAGRNAISVAEFGFAMLVSLARNICKTDYLLKKTDQITGLRTRESVQLKGPSEWSLDENAPFTRYSGPEMFGKDFGIVGLGTIGRAMARLALAYGMRVLVYDPFVDQDEIRRACEGEKVTLEQLMARADYVSLHAKVTDETRGLIDRRYLELMKPTAYLLNTARAAIMDYDALYRILRDGRIAGAAIDVYPNEPITADNPFLSLDNVLLTPHLAGASQDIPRHHSRMITDDILRFFSGKRPVRIMNSVTLGDRFE
jgi:D-3-phosphoglycerate dehydrogenase / 2-oxoglutarate reductase